LRGADLKIIKHKVGLINLPQELGNRALKSRTVALVDTRCSSQEPK